MFKKSFYILPLLGTVSISSCMASNADVLEHRKAVLAAQLGDYYYSLPEQDQVAMACAMDDADEVVTVQNTNVPQIFHGMTADDERAVHEAAFGFILEDDPMSASPVHSNKRPAAYVNSDDDALAAIQAVFGDDNEGPVAAPAPKDKEEEEVVMTPEGSVYAGMDEEANQPDPMDLGEENEVSAFVGMQEIPNPDSPTNLREVQDDEYTKSQQADMRKARLADVNAKIERVKAPFVEARKTLEAELAPIKARFESLESEVENRRGLLKARGENPRLQKELDGFEAELKVILAQLPAYDDAFKQADADERIALINLNKEKALLEKPL